MSLRQEVHNRLWQAFNRWQSLRLTGITKHDLKMRGIREDGNPHLYTGPLIFTGSTLRSYEGLLKQFVEAVQHGRDVERLEDLGKKDFRAFMDRAIENGLAAKTLNRYRSALAKFGALSGQTRSFAALSQHYGRKIRELTRAGAIASPHRQTPCRNLVEQAIAVLRDWDARHYARTGEARGYHLAARIQLETAARSISATDRITRDSLKEGNRLDIVGKGGKAMTFTISQDLHKVLSSFLAQYPGPLASRRGYQSAYARAVRAVGGKVTATHGVRRRAARDEYAHRYQQAVREGMRSTIAASKSAGDVIEFLGHSRHRRDHRAWYLGN